VGKGVNVLYVKQSGARLLALIVPLYFDNKGTTEQFAGVFGILRGLQRDVVYLG
jgi:hypothetical protein